MAATIHRIPVATLEKDCRLYGLSASDDMMRMGFAEKTKTGMRAVIDGKRGPEFEALRKGTPVFSPGGKKSFYVGYENGMAHAMVDGKKEAVFDGIDGIRFSADGLHLAYRAQKKDKSVVVVVDGKEGPDLAAIPPDAFTFSPNGHHHAYAGKDKNGDWLVVRDGKRFKTCEAVAELGFSADSTSLLWIGRTGGKWRVFLDDTEQHASSSQLQVPRASPDLTRISWVRQEGTKYRVEEKEAKGELWDQIAPPMISKDGRLLVHPARKKQKWTMVVNHEAGKKFDQVGMPIFSKDGAHYAFPFVKNGKSGFVVDGRVGPKFVHADSFIFGPDGSHAYRARKGEKWHVIHNGKKSPPHVGVLAPGFQPDGTLVHVAMDDGGATLYRNHEPVHSALSISPPSWSEDGKVLCAAAKEEDGWWVLVNETRHKVDVDAFVNRTPFLPVSDREFVGIAWSLPGPAFSRIRIHTDDLPTKTSD